MNIAKEMSPGDIENGGTVQYKIVPVTRFIIQRVTTNQTAEVTEEIALMSDVLDALMSDVLDARLAARAMTEYERRNPQAPNFSVQSFEDVEIH